MIVRPNGRFANQTATSEHDHQDHDRPREDLDDRQVADAAASDLAEAVGRIAGRGAARPVQRRAEQREHHAEGHDEARHLEERHDQAVHEPDERAEREHEGEHGQRLRVVLADEVARDHHLRRDQEPIDRSNSPPTMTKYWPIATIAIGATRCMNRMSCDGSANVGFSSVIGHEQDDEQQEHGAARAHQRAADVGEAHRPKLGRSDVTAVMPTPPVRAAASGGRRAAGRPT